MTSNRTEFRRHAFTLVELLVVIGIVALLVALLLPALSGAREQARRARCGANLHSIGQAITMYVQQSGYYPVCFLADPSKPAVNFSIWPAQVRLFMPGDHEPFFCPAQDERCAWPMRGAPAPAAHKGARADAYHTSFGYEMDELLLQVEPGYFSYGYNYAGARGVAADPMSRGLGGIILRHMIAEQGTGSVRADRVKSASQMIAVADATADGFWDTAIAPGAPKVYPGRIHKGGANVLFCDGHVQWYPQSDLVLGPVYESPENLPKRRMWNRDHQP